jgi:hypothetical protein
MGDLHNDYRALTEALKAENAKLRAEAERLTKDCVTLHEADLRHARSLELQVDGLRKYIALLGAELESAIGMAYTNGWRSTPERIEAGKKLRAELGLGTELAIPSIVEKPKQECTQCNVVNGLHEAGCCFEKRKCECGVEITPEGHPCGYWNERR